MITWETTTCACIIRCERPSVEGEFLVRCKSHRTTVKAYEHNITFRQATARAIEDERAKPEFQEDPDFVRSR